MQVVQNSGSS